MNRRARAAVIVSAVLVVVAVIVGVARLWTYVGDRSATDRKLTAIAIENHANGEQVKAIAQTLLSVTGPDAQARQAASTVDILKRNAIELDCRSRRQQARLVAPPDPTKPCTDQTPLDVYPGVDGQPARSTP